MPQWPSREEIEALNPEELAVLLLHRLAAGRQDSDLSQQGFINTEVCQAVIAARRITETGAIGVRSEEALRIFPRLARALGEAFSILRTDGLIADDPAAPGMVFVTSRGLRRLTAEPEVAPPISSATSDAWAPVEVPDAPQHPAASAVISYAHADPGWSEGRRELWTQQILLLALLLRNNGIDVIVDRYLTAADWARFGPREIRDRDFTLAIMSDGYRRAWENDSPSPGAKAEVDVLLGIKSAEPDRFERMFVPVLLPDVTASSIPAEISATTSRVRVTELTRQGVEPLLRRLLDRPAVEVPAIGAVPDLAPRYPASEEELSRAIEEGRRTLSTPSAPSDGRGAPGELIRRTDALKARLGQVTVPPARSISLRPGPGGASGPFNLHGTGSPFHAHVANASAMPVIVRRARLISPAGSLVGALHDDPTVSADDLEMRLEAGEAVALRFAGEGTSALASSDGDRLRLEVDAEFADGLGPIFRYAVALRRKPGTGGRAQWRAGEEGVEPLG